jgi:hypothetical protein
VPTPVDGAHHSLETQVAVIATKVDAIDGKLDKADLKLSALDSKVDAIEGSMQQMKGVIAVVRFLGLGGVAIALVALLRAFGVEVDTP